MKSIFFLLGVSGLAAAPPATFYKDVLPVLQKNCQECHRPGEAAPMSFLSYAETRPWAKAIRQAVLSKKMPPWFADPHVGKFTNERSLSTAERDMLVAWADSGATAGDPKDGPAPRTFTTGWTIGTPDVVFDMPETYSVPDSGTIEYTYFIVPTGFTANKWVQMAEARPGNRTVVHHIIAYVRTPESKWMRSYPVGKAFVPNRKGDHEGPSEFLTGYAPGAPPESLRPGQAKLIPAGSDIVFQMHYTAAGKAATDRSKVGLVFAKETPAQRVTTLSVANGKFAIPPGADNHRVDASMTLQADSEMIALLPHMHLRGKSFEMRAIYPTGETEALLRVPRYDFNWQLWYQLPLAKKLPKGTRIEATAWFDNSANNKANPDPTKEVHWGDQSWEEMMIGFFNVAIPADQDPAELLKKKKAATETSSGGE